MESRILKKKEDKKEETEDNLKKEICIGSSHLFILTYCKYMKI